jgi:alanine-glyoxylate transaminase/(R)-3-amino-2-methylpropionate-pyruvate transaminase
VTVSAGHCHPEIVKAVNKQSELLQHTTTIYLNNQIAEYAKELADKMPGNLKVLSISAYSKGISSLNV